MKSTLYLSITLNVLLGAMIVFALEHGKSEGAKASEAVAQLKSGDIAEVDAEHVLAQYLLDTSAPTIHDEYWRPRPIRDFRRQSALLTAAEQARRRVVERNGQGAVDDPAFRALFRPLDAEFPFLSSAKQIELERLRHDLLRRRAELLTQGATPDEQSRIQGDFQASLRQLLTADELFEYRLRTSPAAQTLLAGGFQFEEQEFRQVFRAVVAAAGEDVLLTGLAYGSSPAVTAAIRNELGATRFAEYQKAKNVTTANGPIRMQPRAALFTAHKE